MDTRCKAKKNRLDIIQCPNKSKPNEQFCGKHIKIGLTNLYIPITTDKDNNGIDNTIIETSKQYSMNYIRQQIIKKLSDQTLYNDYFNLRKTYLTNNDSIITLLDYIENNKLESYAISRIYNTLESYGIKQIKREYQNKFMFASSNINRLYKIFELLLNATEHLDKIIKIQRFIRSSLQNLDKKLRGPAYKNISLCVNEIDFFTLDPINEIEDNDFFSFKEEKGCIYGFSLDSIFQLIIKNDENYWEHFNTSHVNLCYKQYIRVLFNHYNKLKISNPYNRNLLPSEVRMNVIHLMVKRIFDEKKKKRRQSTNDVPLAQVQQIDFKTQVRNKCLSIFQKIDIHGYMTNINWLMEERPAMLRIFYKKLSLLWNFEFGLSENAKLKIAGCSGSLFSNIGEVMNPRYDKYYILDKILDVMKKLVSNGETESDKQSGCILILYALAIINQDTIRSNPWLG
jgi:hypothetical protein